MPHTIESHRQCVEQHLEQLLPLQPCRQQKVIEAMRYSLLGGGKRIRAVLTLEICTALGGALESALDAACAIEMIHAYSLIHDDLPCMDNDDLRRGKPTSHKQFGEAIAVLAGDGLLTLSFEILSSARVVDLLGTRAIDCIRALAQASGTQGMLGGQTIDLLNEGIPLDAAGQHEMVRLKTGALIAVAAQCGCICADATAEKTEAVLGLAKKLGLAFQITDDILDVVASTSVLGKTVGKDQQQQKNTFVSLYGLEEAMRLSQTLHQEAVELAQTHLPNSAVLLELIDVLASRTY